MIAARFSFSGALAGAVSALAFALVHDIFIGDIWFSLAALLAAGAVCGLCLGWTYALLEARPTIRRWLGYNVLFVGMFVLLAVVSVLVFEPITTVADVIAGNGPPGDLISRAMPLTVVFTLAMAGLISRVYAGGWSRFVPVLLTCSVLVLLLGLNISVIGLVSVPRSSFYLVLEMFGLVLALNAAFAGAFILLERRIFFG